MKQLPGNEIDSKSTENKKKQEIKNKTRFDRPPSL
jgi:hypothetical protein